MIITKREFGTKEDAIWLADNKNVHEVNYTWHEGLQRGVIEYKLETEMKHEEEA